MPLNPRITDWTGLRVWLIGASSGIGLALAEHLHARGAIVTVSARKAEALQAFAHAHPGSIALPVDVSDGPGMQIAARAVLAAGPLDLVCYCAGHYRPMRATAIDAEDLLRHHDINTAGALRMLGSVVPALLKQGSGHISLISSVAGFGGLPLSLAYGPTKAALINLAETLYLDLRPQGLGVSLINPGFVQTPLTAGNQFHMPALITADQAARVILQGWSEGNFEIHFPKRFTRVLKLLQWLPYRWYFSVVKRATGF